MTTIPSTPADGNVRTDILTVEPADLTALTLSELTAGSVAQISLYLVPGGFAGTTQQATIADPREPSTEDFGQPGRKTRSLSITGIDNTNSVNDASFNLLVDTMTEDAPRWAVRRRGIAWDTPWAAGQEYEAWPFKPGVRQEVVAAANETQRSTWSCFVVGQVVKGVVAGTAPVPTISTVLPSGASAAELVTITGDYFIGATAVTFGGTAAADFEVVSATKIVASLPTGSAGSAAVIVTTPSGASTAKAYTRA